MTVLLPGVNILPVFGWKGEQLAFVVETEHIIDRDTLTGKGSLDWQIINGLPGDERVNQVAGVIKQMLLYT